MQRMGCSIKGFFHCQFVRWLAMLTIVMCGLSSAFAQEDAPEEKFKDLLDGALVFQPSENATFTATLTPANAKPGDEVTLTVIAQLPPKSYIYATTGDFGERTRITIVKTEGLDQIGKEFEPDRAPEVQQDKVLNQEVQKFHGDVSWTMKFRVKADAEPGKVSADLQLTGQYCSEGEVAQCKLIRPPAEMHAELDDKLVEFSSKVRPKRGKVSPVELEFQLGPTRASEGKRVKLLVSLTMDPEWHTFSTTFTGEGGTATEITLDKVYGLKAIGKEFVPNRPPELKSVPELKLTQEVYHGRVTWSQEFEVLPNSKPFAYGVEGSVTFQTCKDSCLPPKSVPFTLGVLDDQTTPPKYLAFLDEPQDDKNLLVFLFTAVVAGMVALLTPCVFPMVPITVSFFLKQNEAKGGRPIVLAMVFSGAIVASFVVLGVGIAAVFGATKPNELANNWVLNLFLATVFFAFALNMLGMFEIQVPSWLLSMTASGEQTGGFIGVIFMALTFVLTSFSCTFAFVGSLLAAAAQGEYYWPILGMLAFGATFATPFFVLALMPRALKALPKSGGWLNSVKVVMGFVEAGVAVKYFSIVDQQWNAVPWIFDFTNVMTLWAVLSVCTGLYLLGQFRLSHDSPVQGLSPIRVLMAMGFLILGGLFAVGLMNPERESWLIDQLVAFAPARLDNEDYQLDFDHAVADASRANKPLFIDFTGVNCVNCRLMEKKLAKRNYQRRLERCVLVQLYTDKVPKITDTNESHRLLERNIALQKAWYGDVTLPSYAIATPDGKTILARYTGLERRTGEFVRFLDEGWEKWSALHAQDVTNIDKKPAQKD